MARTHGRYEWGVGERVKKKKEKRAAAGCSVVSAVSGAGACAQRGDGDQWGGRTGGRGKPASQARIAERAKEKESEVRTPPGMYGRCPTRRVIPVPPCLSTVPGAAGPGRAPAHYVPRAVAPAGAPSPFSPMPPIRIALLLCGGLSGTALAQNPGDYLDLYTRYLADTFPAASIAPDTPAKSGGQQPFTLDPYFVWRDALVDESAYPDPEAYDALVLTGSGASLSCILVRNGSAALTHSILYSLSIPVSSFIAPHQTTSRNADLSPPLHTCSQTHQPPTHTTTSPG